MAMRDVRAGVREALDLVTPCFCAGCGRLGDALCVRCEAAFYEPPRRVELIATSLPVWAAASYEGEVRRAILAWKRGRADLAPRIAAAYRELADRWRASNGDGIGVVVPAPSRWRRKLSGTFVVAGAARAVADGLGIAMVDVLRKRGGGHSGSLGALARSRSAGTISLRESANLPGEVLLVDDVVTTGVTLDASARALAERGVRVRAAIVLAATPKRSGV